MPRQLPFDCIDEILKFLEKDKVTLYSCLLTNRLWCRISVKILWRNIWKINHPQIFENLIACLPNESKDLLHKEGIFILAPNSKPPLFNYTSFIKVISIEGIVKMLKSFIKGQPSIVSRNHQNLVIQEILKMFMKQISSLEKLTLYDKKINMTITHFPGARDCLTDLSKLTCSNVHSELCHQLSQICHNIQSLKIEIDDNYTTSNGLKDLISSQNNLKYLSLTRSDGKNLSSLMKHSNTLIKLKIKWVYKLSFITKFTNLQVLILSFNHNFPFNELQYAIFPQLQILKFSVVCPEVEMLIKFLEINGKNLKEFYVIKSDDSLNLAIAKFCPNMKSLQTLFMKDEIKTLKIIFNSCQRLESIESWCGNIFLDMNVMLRTVVNHSPKNFHELRLRINLKNQKLHSRNLEFFFSSWKDRKPQKLLSIIVIKNFVGHDSKKSMKVIEKYKKLGVIKKFEWRQGKYLEEKDTCDYFSI